MKHGRATDYFWNKASCITGVTLRADGDLILPGMPEDTAMLSPNKGW